MKNLPDKIYILQHEDYSDRRILNAFTEKESNTDVEYVRTDAFIEKMQDWLRTHSEADYFELIPDANYCGAGNLNKKRMIEDLKNYIKGE